LHKWIRSAPKSCGWIGNPSGTGKSTNVGQAKTLGCKRKKQVLTNKTWLVTNGNDSTEVKNPTTREAEELTLTSNSNQLETTEKGDVT